MGAMVGSNSWVVTRTKEGMNTSKHFALGFFPFFPFHVCGMGAPMCVCARTCCAHMCACVGCACTWSLEAAVRDGLDTFLPCSLRWNLAVKPRVAGMIGLAGYLALGVLSPSSMAGMTGRLPGPLALKEVGGSCLNLVLMLVRQSLQLLSLSSAPKRLWN